MQPCTARTSYNTEIPKARDQNVNPELGRSVLARRLLSDISTPRQGKGATDALNGHVQKSASKLPDLAKSLLQPEKLELGFARKPN